MMRVRSTACAVLIGALSWAIPAAAHASAAGTISTLAGATAPSGPATSLGQTPDGVAVAPGGGFYVADETSNTIREVSASGQETTVAAGVNDPAGLAVDGAGDLVISEYGTDRVRLLAAVDCSSDCPYGLPSMVHGEIYTVAGGGASGPAGDGGPATSAGLAGPVQTAADATGDLLIADSFDNEVRLVAASDCSSGCPYGLTATTRGDIYTVAGGGVATGSGGPATGESLQFADGVTVDQSDDVLIGSQGNVFLVAAADCSSGCPDGLTTMTKGHIYTIAGTGSFGDSGDGGPATSAQVSLPFGLTTDSAGDLLFSDSFGNTVRLIAAAACSSDCPFGLASMTEGDIYRIAGDSAPGHDSGDGGPATSARMTSPSDLAIDPSGNLLIAEDGNAVPTASPPRRRTMPTRSPETGLRATRATAVRRPTPVWSSRPRSSPTPPAM
jgi:hypothetical protein